jgi:hypothetical protein
VKRIIALLISLFWMTPAFAQWVPPPTGTGTVTEVSAGNLSPLFTTTVTTGTTTPIINFLLSNAPGNSVYCRANATTGLPAFLQGTSNGTFLGISGGVLGFYAGGAGTVTSVTLANAGLGFLGISNPTITTSGTITLTASNAKGDLPYGSAIDAFSNLPIGSTGQVLTVSGSGLPAWQNGGSGTVTNFSAGNLSTWFNTTVTNSTTTPNLAFNPTGNAGDIPYYSATNTPANLPIGGAGTYLSVVGGEPTWVELAGPIAPDQAYDPGGRLTAVSGQPVPVGDIVGFPTQAPSNHLYYTPYTSDQIPLYTGVEWEIVTFTETSINVPNDDPFDILDVFGYDAGGGTLALELDSWNAGGVQTFGAITGATAAQPCAISGAAGSMSGLAIGDLVGIYNGAGSLYNDPYAGIATNAKILVVSGVFATEDSSTATLDDTNTTGLTDSGDGYWVLVPSTRAVPLTTQNGRLVKGTDPTRLYLGTIMPGLSVSPD